MSYASRMRPVWFVVALAGCGTTSPAPFLIETTDCALVNNFTVNGAPSAWNDCRVYWSGAPDEMLTVELTTPGSSGSFLEPGAWVRATAHVPGGSLNGALTTVAYMPADVLPTSLAADQLALHMTIIGCGDVGSSGGRLQMNTMAEVGERSASFSMSVPTYTCYYSGGQAVLGGGFVVSASAAASAMADPSTVVGPLP